jgi:hypothetical protein
MNDKFSKFSGSSCIIGSVLLFLSWSAIGLLTLKEQIADDYIRMASSSYWTPINTIILLSFILIAIGIIGIYFRQSEKSSWWKLTGFVFSMIGVILFICIQLYETFFWPSRITREPLIYVQVSDLPGNVFVNWLGILQGVFWRIGFFVFGAFTTGSGHFPKWAGYVFMVGAVAFGMNIIIFVKVLILALFCTGLFGLGLALWSDNHLKGS